MSVLGYLKPNGDVLKKLSWRSVLALVIVIVFGLALAIVTVIGLAVVIVIVIGSALTIVVVIALK